MPKDTKSAHGADPREERLASLNANTGGPEPTRIPVFPAELLSNIKEFDGLTDDAAKKAAEVQFRNFLGTRDIKDVDGKPVEELSGEFLKDAVKDWIDVDISTYIDEQHTRREQLLTSRNMVLVPDYKHEIDSGMFVIQEAEAGLGDLIYAGTSELSSEELQEQIRGRVEFIDRLHIRANGIEAIELILDHFELPHLEVLSTTPGRTLYVQYRNLYESLESVPANSQDQVLKLATAKAFITETMDYIGGEGISVETYADQVKKVCDKAKLIIEEEVQLDFNQLMLVGKDIKSVSLGSTRDFSESDVLVACFDHFYKAGEISAQSCIENQEFGIANSARPGFDGTPIRDRVINPKPSQKGGKFEKVKGAVSGAASWINRDRRRRVADNNAVNSGKKNDDDRKSKIFTKRSVKIATVATAVLAGAGIAWGLNQRGGGTDHSSEANNGDGVGTSRSATPDSSNTIIVSSPTAQGESSPASNLTGVAIAGVVGTESIATATDTATSTVTATATAVPSTSPGASPTGIAPTATPDSPSGNQGGGTTTGGTVIETAKNWSQLDQGVSRLAVDRYTSPDDKIDGSIEIKIGDRDNFTKATERAFAQLGVTDPHDIASYVKFIQKQQGKNLGTVYSGDVIKLNPELVNEIAYIQRTTGISLPEKIANDLLKAQIPVDDSIHNVAGAPDLAVPVSVVGDATSTHNTPANSELTGRSRGAQASIKINQDGGNGGAGVDAVNTGNNVSGESVLSALGLETPTPTDEATPTTIPMTHTIVPGPTNTPAPTETTTPYPAPSETPTSTNTATATSTVEATPTDEATPTTIPMTHTPESTNTSTNTPTPKATKTPHRERRESPTPTNTATPIVSASPTPTNSPIPTGTPEVKLPDTGFGRNGSNNEPWFGWAAMMAAASTAPFVYGLWNNRRKKKNRGLFASDLFAPALAVSTDDEEEDDNDNFGARTENK